MSKQLSCGCVPDQYDCGECTRKRREKIWANMSAKDKAYDRWRAPEPSKALDDALNNYMKDEGCSCHIVVPCNYCINQSKEPSDEK